MVLQIIQLVDELPRTTVGIAIGGQLVRNGTSVGASYRAICGSGSKSEFLVRVYNRRKSLKVRKGNPLFLNESNELTAIFTRSINSTKGK